MLFEMIRRFAAWLNEKTHDHVGVIGFVVLTVAVSASFVGYSHTISRIEHQQKTTSTLAKRTAELIRETAVSTRRICEEQKTLRDILLAVAVNQPDIDPRIVAVLAEALRKLPEACP